MEVDRSKDTAYGRCLTVVGKVVVKYAETRYTRSVRRFEKIEKNKRKGAGGNTDEGTGLSEVLQCNHE